MTTSKVRPRLGSRALPQLEKVRTGIAGFDEITGGGVPRGRPTIVCEMTIAYKMIHETFTTRVTLDRTELQIIVDYLSGPFRKLENRWRFRGVAEPMCEVEFFLLYEFQSRTFGMLMGAMFEAVFRRFADAFERRADQIYGRPAQA